MATTQDALSAWDRLLNLFQIFSRVRFGLLGDGRGTVAVPGKYGWSWIRFDGEQSKLSQVRNYVTNVVDGLPVVVGKRHPSDDFEQVLYVALDLYSQKLTEKILIDYLNPPHGESHHGTYGSDPAPIDLNNLMPGRLQRTDPCSMSVFVHRFYYPYGMNLDEFPSGTIDLTAHVPGIAGHRYVLVYVEIDSGVLNSVAGSIVPLAVSPDIPDAPEWCIPIGVVALENGQTEICGNYWQYKLLWGSIGQLVTEHTHSSPTQGGTSIVGLEELMFSCHEPLYLMGNAIYPTHTYHSLYIQGMYIDDLDVEEDLIWIHPDPVWGCGQMLIIRPGVNGIYTDYKINVRHGVGNIWLYGERDIVLDNPQDHLLLMYDGTYWCDFIPSQSRFFGRKSDYSEFEADGTLAFHGEATVWDDLYFPMSSGKVGGVNQPTWAAFQGNTYEYTFAINDYIHLPSGEIIHKYLEGSDIELHVHIVLDGSDVGDTYVNYEIEYTIGDVGEVMSAATVVTSGDTLIAGGTADRIHIRVIVASIAGAGLKINAALKMRFRRIALVGGGLNAPSNDPFVMMVGAHIEEDTVGSRTENVK